MPGQAEEAQPGAYRSVRGGGLLQGDVSSTRAGHFRYFKIFLNIAFFIKLIWQGVGILKRIGAEIGYYLDKKMQKKSYLLLKKWKNTESAQLWFLHSTAYNPNSSTVAEQDLNRQAAHKGYDF